MTAHGDVETLLSARTLGTVDYVAKPLAKDDLRLRAEAALSRSRQAGEIKDLRERLDKRFGFEAILGICKPMEELFARLRVVAPAKTTVLIVGESGTGKELVANALHHNSPRRGRAFVALNCGAIPREIIESELFGHERGAFTGALVKRVGRIEQAHGGTLFLDEVSEMPPDLQVKFLRVLEEKRVTPVGGNETKDVDFRLVAATNRDLIAGDRRRALPPGPLLPPLRRHRRDPAAARAARRHPPSRRALPRRLRARARNARDGRDARGSLGARRLRVAGQRPRAEERRRERRPLRRRRPHRRQRPAGGGARPRGLPAARPRPQKPRLGRMAGRPVRNPGCAGSRIGARRLRKSPSPSRHSSARRWPRSSARRSSRRFRCREETGAVPPRRLGIGLRTLQRKLKEYRGEPLGDDDGDEEGDEAAD